MEGAGGQSKQTNISQAAPFPGCSSSPSKNCFEKRKLSLRSKNATTAFTTQTASSVSRQQIPLVQKQYGKENELPSDQDFTERKLATITKSENRKKKSSIPAGCTDLEKRVLKRRLSGDYRDHRLPSNKFNRGQIEPVNQSAKLGESFQTAGGIKSQDNRSKFLIYDDARDKEIENGIEREVFSKNFATRSFRVQDLEHREFDSAMKAVEKKSRDPSSSYDSSDKSSGKKFVPLKSEPIEKVLRTEDSSTEKKLSTMIDSNFSHESSDAEFRIERVDRRDGMTSAMNNLRKFKSGSSIGRLKMTVRRGDEISPLKRRFNRFKRSIMNLKSNTDVKTALTTALKSSEIGFKNVEEVKKISQKRSSFITESTLRSSATTTDKTNFEIFDDREMKCESEKSRCRRRLSEPTTMCLRGIEAELSIGEDKRKISSNSVFQDSLIGIHSQQPVVTLPPSSSNSKNGSRSSGRCDDTDHDVEDIGPCEQDMQLRNKWDAVVAEFKSKFEHHRREKERPIDTVVSNEMVKLSTPGGTPCSRLQSSLSSRSKRFAKSETKVIKSATRSQMQKVIKTQPLSTAIGTRDESENSAQDKDLEDCPRTAFKNLRTSRKLLKHDHDATNYEEEIIDIEYARERRAYQISKMFLKGKTILPEQRRIVVNFLIGVHAYLLTSSSTLYQAIKIFDAILDLKDVSMKELQLVALGASWIAIKNIETNIPSANEMISFAKDMYRPGGSKLLCRCEQKILKTLNFNLRFSDPFYMLAYYIDQGLVSGILPGEPTVRKIYHCAGYLMNIALLDERYSSTSAQLLAAAASQTAVHLVLGGSDNRAKWFRWHNEKTTSYSQGEIERFVEPVLNGVLESAEKSSSTNAVYKKYKSNRYENISDYLMMKIKNLPQFIHAK